MKKFLAYIRLPFELLGILLIIIIFRLMTLDMGAKFAAAIGRFSHRFAKPVNKRIRKNLKRAMPELTDLEVEKITGEMYETLAMVGCEYLNYNRLKMLAMTDRFEIEGLEHLEEIKKSGKPAILYSAHLANWGIVTLLAAQAGLHVTQLYRRFNNRIFDWYVGRLHENNKIEAIWKGAEGGKRAIKALRENRTLVMFVDQKLNEGDLIPFFGIPAKTPAAPARLAIKMKCPLVPVQVIRKGTQTRFKIIIHPPMEHPTEGSIQDQVVALMTDVNKVIESWVRENPGAWLWAHNRWPKKKVPGDQND